MSSRSRPAGKFSAWEIAALALMGALIFAVKAALAAIPNVQLNAVLIILTTVFFGWKALYSVGIYIILEGLVYGGNGIFLWWFSYLYIWPLLVVICMLFRKNNSVLIWAVIAAFFGLAFGPLMYLLYFTVEGSWKGFFAMWIAGIPFDLTHAANNFVSTLVLYPPLYRVMDAIINSKKRKGI